MTEYRVSWEIDVSADTPEEAAQQAFRLVQAPTTATVFEVTKTISESSAGTVVHTEIVDLGPIGGKEG